MKVTVFDLQGKKKFSFVASRSIDLRRRTTSPLSYHGYSVHTTPQWENVEITTAINKDDYSSFHELMAYPADIVKLKVQAAVMCYLTGYFERMDTQMHPDGIIELKFSFNVMEVSQMFDMGDFETAILHSTTLDEAIDAAMRSIRIEGK